MKIVVAYSGGLDTSYTVMYLANQGHEVYAACADTGGFSPAQLKKNEENAYKLGAKAYATLDVKDEYYEKSLKYMVYGNVLRGGTYPISVSSERIFQAIAIARYAKMVGADAIAHGSTGAGNDQVRFDMTFQVMCPDMKIITSPATRPSPGRKRSTTSTPTASRPISPNSSIPTTWASGAPPSAAVNCWTAPRASPNRPT